MNPRYPLVANRARRRCEYCRAPEVVANNYFEVEHIVPVAQGGADDENNLALACRSCNSRKRDLVSGLDADTGVTAPLFHPRADRWDDHFEVDCEAGLITGRTPTGRVTVAVLDLNHPQQVVARLLWIRFRVFP